MKHFFTLFLGVIFMLGLQHHAMAADTCKIGIVDIQQLQEKSSAFQEVNNSLKSKMEVLQKKLEKEKNAVIKLEEELQKQGMMLSAVAKEDKLKELAQKKRHAKYIYDEVMQELKMAELEAMKLVSNEIKKVVEKIGKKGGYQAIFEKRSTGLLYDDSALDITDQVIKAYDQSK
ncbi:MAG: OmpH family outer membrane protein [Desulfobacterales bacterium]|nr:OmpH family outer membrane protein [Desulfobacterales bacterium]